MALNDPQTVTIATVANPLPRINSGNSSSTYQKDDGTVKLSVSHSYGARRIRRTVRLEYSKVSPDVFTPSVNLKHSMSAYVVIDTPNIGLSVTEQKSIVDALAAWLTATSGANTLKVLGGEN